MYVLRHKELNLYLAGAYGPITDDINKARVFTRRPMYVIRHWNTDMRNYPNFHLRTFEGMQLSMRDFEIRPITIIVL